MNNIDIRNLIGLSKINGSGQFGEICKHTQLKSSWVSYNFSLMSIKGVKVFKFVQGVI